MCLKVLVVAVVMVTRILLMKEFLCGGHSMNFKNDHLKMVDLKFCTHSSNRLLHKIVPTVFLIMTYSAFAAIL